MDNNNNNGPDELRGILAIITVCFCAGLIAYGFKVYASLPAADGIPGPRIGMFALIAGIIIVMGVSACLYIDGED